jgi:hypothetical protein
MKITTHWSAAAMGFLLPLLGWSQGVPVLHAGNIEVSGFGTALFGSTLGGLTSTNPSPGMPTFTIVSPSSNGGGGAEADWALTARVRLYAEWTYIAGGLTVFNQDYVVNPPAGATLASTGRSLSAETSSYSVLGGAQVLFPWARRPKIVPYGSLGLGVLGSKGGSSSATIGGAPGLTSSGSLRATSLAAVGGVGLRYYFTERAGLRFEVNGIFGPSRSVTVGPIPATVSANPTHFGRFVFGVFYQFR